jgi:hypothetical protein
MDIDDEDDVDSQRPPFDPAALERELNQKYKKQNLFHAITLLTSHLGIQIDPTTILKHFHSMSSSKTSSTL